MATIFATRVVDMYRPARCGAHALRRQGRGRSPRSRWLPRPPGRCWCGPGHEAGVGRGQAAHVVRQRHRCFVLPRRGGEIQQRTFGERLCGTDHATVCSKGKGDPTLGIIPRNQGGGGKCRLRRERMQAIQGGPRRAWATACDGTARALVGCYFWGNGVMLGVLSHVAGQHLAWHWGQRHGFRQFHWQPPCAWWCSCCLWRPVSHGTPRSPTAPALDPSPTLWPALRSRRSHGRLTCHCTPARTDGYGADTAACCAGGEGSTISSYAAMQDADAGTVRDLAKPPDAWTSLEARADLWPRRMASAATSTPARRDHGPVLRTMRNAKAGILGKSRVGERSPQQRPRHLHVQLYWRGQKDCRSRVPALLGR